MAKLLKIGIAGCGAIGSSLAKTISSDFPGKAKLAGIYDIDLEKAYKLASELKDKKLAVLNIDDLINKSDLIVEATRQESAVEITKKALLSGRDIMIMSVGGIVDFFKELCVLAEEKGDRIFIPSGAICGLDGLKAANRGKIYKVALTTKKPPRAFLGVPYILKRKINLNEINKDTVLFEGDALSAIRVFPQNINVAATLSLAGIGAKETIVRIIASPDTERNIHELEIECESGKIFSRTENIPHPDNPKTSYFAVLSAGACLKQILEPIKIGT
jgi:aspartate dehydrogenase